MSSIQSIAAIQIQLALNKRLYDLNMISGSMFKEAQEQLQIRLEKLRGGNGNDL